MSARTLHERVEQLRGFRYIRLKSGRLISFWEALDAAKAGETDLSRGLSRAFKLADDDYDLERLEWFIDGLYAYLGSVRKEIERRRGLRSKEERIALLRNTTGRTPEEAEAFRRKADELERQLQEEAM